MLANSRRAWCQLVHFWCKELRQTRRHAAELFWDKLGQESVFGWLQVIENMVELVGIEPTTSSLRTMRSPS